MSIFKIALDRAVDVTTSEDDIAALFITVVHKSSTDRYKIEVISAGDDDIINTLKYKLGFVKDYNVPIGRKI